MNILNQIDAYKYDHRRQYPAGTEHVYSNLTPRRSHVEGMDEVVLFGLRAFLQTWMQDAFAEFFAADVDTVCSEYERRTTSILGPTTIGSDHIRALHALGHVPLVFSSVPEGSTVPVGLPLLTVENTHPEFFWLVNYLETLLSAELWLPCTSATTALRLRALLDERARRTGADPAAVDFQGHDFSMRGMSGVQAAALSGAGHLTSFTGTDCVPAVDLLESLYDGTGLIGGSVTATEHSVMCAGGELDEAETYARLMTQYPTGILSVVSDTWDLWNVLTVIVPGLKEQVLGRDGTLVIRPDSGDPVLILCGDPEAEGPARKGVVELLWDTFGGTTNAAGFRQLDPHIGVIYGDGITYDRARRILDALEAKGFVSTTVVFGVGSFTYQYVTRDTYSFAMKATWAQIDGVGHDLFKNPVTDSGEKKSARGRLAVLPDETGRLRVHNQATREQEAASVLQPVWRDGAFVADRPADDLAAVRARVKEAAARL